MIAMFISLIFFFFFLRLVTLLLYTYVKCHVDYRRCVHLVFPSYTSVKLEKKDKKDKGR